jgi:hypothetical protein
MAVAGEMDLRAQAAAGTTKCMVVGFGPIRCPLFSGSGGVLVGPADGGVH